MSQMFHFFENVVTKAMMPQHRFFVLAGKRTKIKCRSLQNVKISVLFKRNSCSAIDKNAQRLTDVHLSPVLSQLANADQVMRMIRKKNSRKMSQNVRCHLCPKVKEKLFQHPQLAKKSYSHFFTLRCVSSLKPKNRERSKGIYEEAPESMTKMCSFTSHFWLVSAVTIAKEN